jgi:hypothetical protein
VLIMGRTRPVSLKLLLCYKRKEINHEWALYVPELVDPANVIMANQISSSRILCISVAVESQRTVEKCVV